MLYLHTLLYAIARIIPGAINYLAIYLYTRLLAPHDYGRYSIVVALVTFANIVLFQWIRFCLLRFFQACRDDHSQLLGCMAALYSIMLVFSGGAGLLWYFFGPTAGIAKNLILLSLPLLWLMAWYDLTLELMRSGLHPVRYAWFSTIRAAAALALGAALVVFGYTYYGPLVGLACGYFIAGIVLGLGKWKDASLKGLSVSMLKPYLVYGMPMMATLSFTCIILYSDRLLIAWLKGEDAAGIYSASYDLIFWAISLVMVTIHLASYPLAVKAFEQDGASGTEKALRENGTLLLLIAVPATGVFFFFGPQIITIFLGEKFRAGGIPLAPWISLGALCYGIRLYHFDLVFQLSKKTMVQMWIMGVGAVVNIAANLLWIPQFGLSGAARAMLLAYLVTLVCSIYWGRSLIIAPLLNRDTLKIILSATGAFALAWPLNGVLGGLAGLLTQLSVVALCYCGIAWLSNVLNIRKNLFAAKTT